MSENPDARIAALLGENAPPSRDPVFRVRVMERREQRRFRQRLYTMIAGVLLILVLSAFIISIDASTLGTTGLLVAVAAFATARLAFRRSLPRILRHFTL